MQNLWYQINYMTCKTATVTQSPFEAFPQAKSKGKLAGRITQVCHPCLFPACSIPPPPAASTGYPRPSYNSCVVCAGLPTFPNSCMACTGPPMPSPANLPFHSHASCLGLPPLPAEWLAGNWNHPGLLLISNEVTWCCTCGHFTLLS